MHYILMFTASDGLYHYRYHLDGSERDDASKRVLIETNFNEVYNAKLGMWFFLEDGPQYLIQITNSFYVGSSFAWMQLLSPILSCNALLGRVKSLALLPDLIPLKKKNHKVCLITNMLVLSLLLLLAPIVI